MFWVVPVKSESVEAAEEATRILNAAGIGTVGPRWVDRDVLDASWTTKLEVSATVDASDADAAVAIVRMSLPRGGIVGPARSAEAH
jgi:hypothetical protein